MQAVLECLVSDKIGPGDLTRQLSREVAARLDFVGGMVFADDSVAIKAALHSIGAVRSNRILISALAPEIYITTAFQVGLVPVLVDVDPNTAKISLDSLEKNMLKDPVALILTHPAGQIELRSDIREIKIPIIEDISSVCLGLLSGVDETNSRAPKQEKKSEGLKTQVNENFRVSSGDSLSKVISDVVLLSMNGHGPIHTGAGAIILTRKHGTRRILSGYHQRTSSSELANMNAALALSQFNDLEGYKHKCTSLREIYTDALYHTRHSILSTEGGHNFSNLFPVVILEGVREVQKYASKNFIETSLAFEKCALDFLQGYSSVTKNNKFLLQTNVVEDFEKFFDKSASLPGVLKEQLLDDKDIFDNSYGPWAADNLRKRCLLFPMYPNMPETAVEQVAKVLATLP